jgi:hypothetical protein
MSHVIFFLILAGISSLAAAQTPSSLDAVKSIYVNGGLHTEFFNNVQTDSSGGMRKFDYAPVIGAGLRLPIEGQWNFMPELNWVLPHDSNTHIIKNLFMFRGDLAYDALDWLRLRVGTSLMWLNQHGRGGKAKISNGSTTSEFYYPDENRSSLNNTFDLGIEAMYDQWSFRLQTYTYSIFKEEQRQVSYTLFVSYYWER